MLIPSRCPARRASVSSLSRRVNANSQHEYIEAIHVCKLIKKGEC